jgi:hypothetical protein
MVAILLITVGALALASTFVGAAEQTRRASMRTKALEAASQELDRLRSIPYDQLALGTTDPAMNDTDWLTTFCPLRDGAGAPRCSDSVAAIVTDPEVNSSTPADPRQAKRSYGRNTGSLATAALDCGATAASCRKVTVRRQGILLYVYIYWNNWYMPVANTWSPARTDASSQFKIATVVARFLDPEVGTPGTTARQYATVKLSSVLADVPELGQVR